MCGLCALFCFPRADITQFHVIFDFDMPTQCANHCWYSYISVWVNTLHFLLLSPVSCPSVRKFSDRKCFIPLDFEQSAQTQTDCRLHLSSSLTHSEHTGGQQLSTSQVSQCFHSKWAGVIYTANEVKAACRCNTQQARQTDRLVNTNRWVSSTSPMYFKELWWICKPLWCCM